MRLPLVTASLLLAAGPFALADDQPRTATPRTRAGTMTRSDVPAAARPVQPIVRRPVGAPANPNGVTRAGVPNPSLSPTTRNRPIIPNNSLGMAVNRNRPTSDEVRANETRNRPGTTSTVPRTANPTANRIGTTPLRGRTGNELSFSQARAQCKHEPHSRDWWRHHHVLVVLYGGGYWFWNSGWWFPAWGYDPFYSNYVYDGPIYGFGQLSPGDVTAQVQEALAEQGYYYGAIDGVLGPETRDAILRFQADHGLAATAAIDEPTLNTLGLT